jgi:hypothetical protein
MPEMHRQFILLKTCPQLRVAQCAAALRLVEVAAWAASAGVHRERGQGGGRALPARAGCPVLPPRGCQAGAVAGDGDAQRRGAAAGAARAHGRHWAGVWKPDGEGARPCMPWKGDCVVASATSVGGSPSQYPLLFHVSRCSEAGCLRISIPPSLWVNCACAPLQGFQRVADGLADTCLDNPAARERFVDIVSKACLSGPLHSLRVKVYGPRCFPVACEARSLSCCSPCASSVSALSMSGHTNTALIARICVGATVYTKQAGRLASCMVQAERGGWLDAGACGELANAPAAVGSLPDAMSHSVQVPTRGLVPSALPAA